MLSRLSCGVRWVHYPTLVGILAVAACGTLQAAPKTAEVAPQGNGRGPLSAESSTSPSAVHRGGHPLVPAIEFARARYDYVHHHVMDFTCVLVIRERIDGRLRDHEFIRAKARLRQVRDGRVVVPFSVYMQFLAPSKYLGRRVLYVEGENEGKMLVRNGGTRFSYVTVRVDPDSETAMRESRYPVTELGLENVAKRLIERAEDDMLADSEGNNTLVTFFHSAKVDGRPCTRIRVVHPRPDTKLNFHIANVFVDDELLVPIRVEGYGWPVEPGAGPILLEEYTFTRLRLNVGLTNADFVPSLVGN